MPTPFNSSNSKATRKVALERGHSAHDLSSNGTSKGIASTARTKTMAAKANRSKSSDDVVKVSTGKQKKAVQFGSEETREVPSKHQPGEAEGRQTPTLVAQAGARRCIFSHAKNRLSLWSNKADAEESGEGCESPVAEAKADIKKKVSFFRTAKAVKAGTRKVLMESRFADSLRSTAAENEMRSRLGEVSRTLLVDPELSWSMIRTSLQEVEHECNSLVSELSSQGHHVDLSKVSEDINTAVDEIHSLEEASDGCMNMIAFLQNSSEAGVDPAAIWSKLGDARQLVADVMSHGRELKKMLATFATADLHGRGAHMESPSMSSDCDTSRLQRLRTLELEALIQSVPDEMQKALKESFLSDAAHGDPEDNELIQQLYALGGNSNETEKVLEELRCEAWLELACDKLDAVEIAAGNSTGLREVAQQFATNLLEEHPSLRPLTIRRYEAQVRASLIDHVDSNDLEVLVASDPSTERDASAEHTSTTPQQTVAETPALTQDGKEDFDLFLGIDADNGVSHRTPDCEEHHPSKDDLPMTGATGSTEAKCDRRKTLLKMRKIVKKQIAVRSILGASEPSEAGNLSLTVYEHSPEEHWPELVKLDSGSIARFQLTSADELNYEVYGREPGHDCGWRMFGDGTYRMHFGKRGAAVRDMQNVEVWITLSGGVEGDLPVAADAELAETLRRRRVLRIRLQDCSVVEDDKGDSHDSPSVGEKDGDASDASADETEAVTQVRSCHSIPTAPPLAPVGYPRKRASCEADDLESMTPRKSILSVPPNSQTKLRSHSSATSLTMSLDSSLEPLQPVDSFTSSCEDFNLLDLDDQETRPQIAAKRGETDSPSPWTAKQVSTARRRDFSKLRRRFKDIFADFVAWQTMERSGETGRGETVEDAELELQYAMHSCQRLVSEGTGKLAPYQGFLARWQQFGVQQRDRLRKVLLSVPEPLGSESFKERCAAINVLSRNPDAQESSKSKCCKTDTALSEAVRRRLVSVDFAGASPELSRPTSRSDAGATSAASSVCSLPRRKRPGPLAFVGAEPSTRLACGRGFFTVAALPHAAGDRPPAFLPVLPQQRSAHLFGRGSPCSHHGSASSELSSGLDSVLPAASSFTARAAPTQVREKLSAVRRPHAACVKPKASLLQTSELDT